LVRSLGERLGERERESLEVGSGMFELLLHWQDLSHHGQIATSLIPEEENGFVWQEDPLEDQAYYMGLGCSQ